MDHGQVERGIALLLADRRPHVDAPVAELDAGLAGLAILPGDLDPMQALDRDLPHLVGDRVPSVAGQAIDAGAHEEVGARRLRRAEELVDSFSRSPTWTSRAGSSRSAVAWRMFSSQRMLSLASIGTRVGLIRRLSAFVPLNLARVQNLTAASPSGSPSVVTARLACISRPQTVCILSWPLAPRRLGAVVITPIRSGRARR